MHLTIYKNKNYLIKELFWW